MQTGADADVEVGIGMSASDGAAARPAKKRVWAVHDARAGAGAELSF